MGSWTSQSCQENRPSPLEKVSAETHRHVSVVRDVGKLFCKKKDKEHFQVTGLIYFFQFLFVFCSKFSEIRRVVCVEFLA